MGMQHDEDRAENGGDRWSYRIQAVWNRWLGNAGERTAARYLRRHGFRILARGSRLRRGEIDLIAREGDTLVFVEVKTRSRGGGADAVTAEKQRRLTLAALEFLKRYDLLEQRCRFDVIAITWPERAGWFTRPEILHIRNAFEAVGRGQMFR